MKRFIRTIAICIFVFALMVVPVFAAGDPATTITNFTNIIKGVVTALGVIVVIWGGVQVGMSIQSQDASTRTQGFLTIAGGVVFAAAPWIATAIL
jgi:hypothetical protein